MHDNNKIAKVFQFLIYAKYQVSPLMYKNFPILITVGAALYVNGMCIETIETTKNMLQQIIRTSTNTWTNSQNKQERTATEKKSNTKIAIQQCHENYTKTNSQNNK